MPNDTPHTLFARLKKRVSPRTATAILLACAVLAGLGIAYGLATSNDRAEVARDEFETSVAEQVAQDEAELHEPIGEADDEVDAGSGEGAASRSSASTSGGGTVSNAGASSTTNQPSVQQPAADQPPPAPATITVSVTVDRSRASGAVNTHSVTVKQGGSVYDALRATGLALGGSSNYVSSIGGLAEFQHGAGSGWVYLVNGSRPGVGAGAYKLKGGENIRWVYTLDFGNDL